MRREIFEILRSAKAPEGGVKVNKIRIKDITRDLGIGNKEMLQILRLMEGSLAPVACLEAGRSPCDRAGECRTLSLWAGLNDVINKYLDQYTLADLLREDDGFDYVI